jgi:3-deoxy-D-manno-octulosonic-acid transferase
MLLFNIVDKRPENIHYKAMGSIFLKSYQWILRLVVELLDVFPPKRIEKEEFAMRKGIFIRDFEPGEEGTIWVHGASLGEVITLRPFLKKLGEKYGRERIVCTSTTMDGYKQLLKDELCGFASVLPIELPAFMIPFIKKINPKVLLISETEIWPLMLATLAEKKVPYGIINCRINENSVKLMRIAWSLFKPAVENIAFAFPQEKQYMRRLKILGIPAEKQRILGCFKYDISEKMPDVSEIRKQFKIGEDVAILCFGSTHDNEEAQILDAFSPILNDLNAVVIIAPRHTKRVEEVEELLKMRGLKYNKVSEGVEESHKILIVDTMGELRKFYAVSSFAYVGGSLIKRGGHNLMEPAAFNKPIISGPHTFNFRYEMMALKKANAVTVVHNSEDLRNVILDFMANPDKYRTLGENAGALLKTMAGASGRTLSALQELGYLTQ